MHERGAEAARTLAAPGEHHAGVADVRNNHSVVHQDGCDGRAPVIPIRAGFRLQIALIRLHKGIPCSQQCHVLGLQYVVSSAYTTWSHNGRRQTALLA